VPFPDETGNVALGVPFGGVHEAISIGGSNALCNWGLGQRGLKLGHDRPSPTFACFECSQSRKAQKYQASLDFSAFEALHEASWLEPMSKLVAIDRVTRLTGRGTQIEVAPPHSKQWRHSFCSDRALGKRKSTCSSFMYR
jgi:hypothetical protein